MSVMLFEDERFQKIFSSLKASWRDFAFIFKLSDCIETQIDVILQDFVQGLCNANTEAYNERYEDETDLAQRKLKWATTTPYSNRCELLKSLESVKYNSAESVNYNGVKQDLHDVIFSLMFSIIHKLPEYERAETW